MNEIFKPGDTLHYYITFQSPITPHYLEVLFSLTTGPQQTQPGLPTYLALREFHALSAIPPIYEIEGSLGIVTSGTYQLTQITVGLPGGFLRVYRYPTEFKDNVIISVANNLRGDMPEISSISATPPTYRKGVA